MNIFLIVLVMVLWTWGLTPLWVNIVSTVIVAIPVSLKLVAFIIKMFRE